MQLEQNQGYMKEGKIALREATNNVFHTLNNKIKIITIKGSIFLVPGSAVYIFTHLIIVSNFHPLASYEEEI